MMMFVFVVTQLYMMLMASSNNAVSTRSVCLQHAIVLLAVFLFQCIFCEHVTTAGEMADILVTFCLAFVSFMTVLICTAAVLLSSRKVLVLKDQFTSPCSCPRTTSSCPWTARSSKLTTTLYSANSLLSYQVH